MQIVSANVFYEPTNCIKFVQITVPDDTVFTTARDLFTKEWGEYSCNNCTKEHSFDEVLFSNQRVVQWDGKTSTIRHKDGTTGQVIDSNEFSKPCGEDEFSVKVTPTKKIFTSYEGFSQ